MRISTEDRRRTEYWRELFEIAEHKAARDDVVHRAALDLGITSASVRHRWHRLGLCHRIGLLDDVIRRAVIRYPYKSDRELAKIYRSNFSSWGCARRRLKIPPATERRRAALRAEIAAYIEDFPGLGASDIHAAIIADGDLPWRFARQTVSKVMRELKGER
jgi:hypothetical protein